MAGFGHLNAGFKDGWIWRGNPDGKYTIKSAYNTIKAKQGDEIGESEPAKLVAAVWKTPAPHKALVTAWRLLRDRLPTCDNLRKRKITLEEEELQCTFCHEHGESSNHLFALCSRTQEVWNALQKWLGIFTARPSSVNAHWRSFCCVGNEKKIRRFLKMVWVGSCWILWKKRNDKRFEGKEWTVEDVILEIKAWTWCWFKSFGIFDKEMNFFDWSSEDLISRVL